MKLLAARDEDVDDIVALYRLCGFTTVVEGLDLVESVYPGRAVAVELVLDRAQGGAAALDRPREDLVDVLDVHTDGDRCAANGFRRPDAPVRVFVREHDHGGPDLKLGVAEPAVGLGHPHPLGR